jgi:hypothetical protein
LQQHRKEKEAKNEKQTGIANVLVKVQKKKILIQNKKTEKQKD